MGEGEGEGTIIIKAWNLKWMYAEATSIIHSLNVFPPLLQIASPHLSTAQNSTRVMERVLAWEAPDLVVYSGDQVTGENVDSNATAYWLRAVQPCLDTGTPWAAVFGNHGELKMYILKCTMPSLHPYICLSSPLLPFFPLSLPPWSSSLSR